jgi:hypothetical protein
MCTGAGSWIVRTRRCGLVQKEREGVPTGQPGRERLWNDCHNRFVVELDKQRLEYNRIQAGTWTDVAISIISAVSIFSSADTIEIQADAAANRMGYT